MTVPTDDRTRFPEPRRAALRAMLIEQTAPGGADESWERLLLGPVPVPTDVAVAPRRSVARRRLRQCAVAGVAAAAAAAVVVAAVVLPIGRDDARRDPVGPPAAPSVAEPSPARTGLWVRSVPTIASGRPVDNGWTASSCPYLDDVDPATLLGVDTGAVWSGIATPVQCRVFTPAGAPLLDITTFGYNGPGAAADATAELRAGATDVQAPQTRVGDPALGPATVTVFRTDGLTGRDTGWAATIQQGSTAFLVRVAADLDRTVVDRVVGRVVDVATGPGGSALTSSLRLCSHDLGSDFSRAFLGGQVTCSFGGDHATDVSAQYGACPDGSEYIVFWSTAEDATDHATYYGAPSGVLMSSAEPPSAVLPIAQAQVCR